MKTSKTGIISVVGGIIVTALTGAVSSTPSGLVGAVWYGYPTAWLYKLVIAPQYNPWRVHVASLLIDVVFWIAIIAFALTISEAEMDGMKASAPKPAAKGSRRRRK